MEKVIRRNLTERLDFQDLYYYYWKFLVLQLARIFLLYINDSSCNFIFLKQIELIIFDNTSNIIYRKPWKSPTHFASLLDFIFQLALERGKYYPKTYC